MRFDKLMLVGSGKIACDCLKYLTTIVEKDFLTVLETQENSLSMLSKVCQKEDIPYSMKIKKTNVESYILEEIRNKKVLIISANNRFIFTSNIIHTRDVEIINFHYALLPHYRGMNIPTWVIFNKEEQTGVTWHFVTEKVDCGKIIEQRIIPIDETTTAFDITQKGMILGLDAFKSFVGKLIETQITGKDIMYSKQEKIYHSTNLPMNGNIDLNQSIEEIERLLRSFDYRGMSVVPFLQLEYLGVKYIVKKYHVCEMHMVEQRKVQFTNDELSIEENNEKLVMKLQKV